MDASLVLGGLAMGVAATPHCALMCGAPCAALTSGCKRNAAGFQLGRLLGYMAAGALAAGSMSALGAWSQTVPVLRPLWTLLQLAFLALGLWWIATGRQLHWMKRDGAVPVRIVARRRRPLRSGLAGLAWVAWPCAALQGALLLSALASSPQRGALVMAGFAIGSMPALLLAPWAWARWSAWRGKATSPAGLASLGLRLAGAGLVLASGWALMELTWSRYAAWCVT